MQGKKRIHPRFSQALTGLWLGLLELSLAWAGPAPAQGYTLRSDPCLALVRRLPDISLAECRASQLHPSGSISANGFPLLLRDIPHNSPTPAPIRVLLLGGIHGDELSAAAIVFKWLGLVLRSTSQPFDWRIAPVVNPDGLLARTPKRVNAHGVDLNRNFPTPHWQEEAPRYWSQVTRRDPRRFPGKAPLSEPESRWVHALLEQEPPDVIVSVHAPFGVLDYDGPARPPQRFGRLIYQRVGVYPGSLGNYGGIHRDVPVITIELPNANALPNETERNRIWQDMQTWITRNVHKSATQKTHLTTDPRAPATGATRR